MLGLKGCTLLAGIALLPWSMIADNLASIDNDQQVCTSSQEGSVCHFTETYSKDTEEQTTPEGIPSCSLWLAGSTLGSDVLGIFSSTHRENQTLIGGLDVQIPIVNANQNEWSLWHDIASPGTGDTRWFRPGISSLAVCSDPLANIDPHCSDIDITDLGFINDSADFSDLTRNASVAANEIHDGQELFRPCDNFDEASGNAFGQSTKRPVEWLHKYGICVDNLEIKTSTIPDIGRGAFSRRKFKKGDIITTSPVVQFDRSQMEIVKNFRNERDGRIRFTEHVEGHQLLLNYCLGHENSTILLLPYGPSVNYINHYDKPNAYLVWSNSPYSDKDALYATTSEVLYRKQKRLLVDYVAMSDIDVGDEIFLNYGPEWQSAWDQFKFLSRCDFQPGDANLPDSPGDETCTPAQTQQGAFRHEIGVPDGFFPDQWVGPDPKPLGDFLRPKMEVGQIEQIRWSETEVPVTNAYLMRLNPRVREVLLEYCDKMGITEKFRDLTYRGNSLQPNQEGKLELQGLNWYIQRPPHYWKSNMHWISPLDALSHSDYLRALSAAGFDEVLRKIGHHFGLEGLACYHVTFIAVSHSQQGYIHYDMKRTGNRVFNVIIPLILANNTGPELDLQAGTTGDANFPVGRLKYEYDVATLIGDDAYHGTSAVDYRLSKEMRMAATVYIADIQKDNIDSIMADYTQNYPPPRRKDLLLGMAGIHWKRKDPYVSLPEPFTDDFESYPLAPNTIAPFIWKRSQKPVSDSIYKVGLPFNMQRDLVDYFSQIGVLERCVTLLDGQKESNGRDNSQSFIERFAGFRWKLQKTSEALWATPSDRKAFDATLSHLLLGGFDGVLESISRHIDVNGMDVHGIAVVAVSKTFTGKAMYRISAEPFTLVNVIIPLAVESPAVEVCGQNERAGRYVFDIDEALMLPDGHRAGVSMLDYHSVREHHVSLSILASGSNETVTTVDFGEALPTRDDHDTEMIFRWSSQNATTYKPHRQWLIF